MTITARHVLTAIVAVSVLGTGMALAHDSVPYSNDFESATQYAPATNMANWSSTTDDQSMVTNVTYTYTTTSRWAAAHTKVLRLNTQGAVLTNDITAPATAGIYVDTMVQFVPSDTTPAACTPTDAGIKLAVFANASSNLVVYHGAAAGGSAWQSNVLETTATTLDAANWYRVTVLYKDHSAGSPLNEVAMFQLKIDGVLISSTLAYADGWELYMDNNNGALPALGTPGTWFLAATDGNKANLTAVAFQGTGYIDDLLVSGNNPFAQGAGPWNVRMVYGTAGGSSDLSPNPDSVANGSPKTIVYTANDYKRIGVLLRDGVDQSVPAGTKVYTQTIASVTADISNNVTFVNATAGQIGLPSGVDPDWVDNYYVTEAAALADGNLATDYMLKQDPTATYTAALAVKSIAVTDSTNVSVVVTLSGVPVTNMTINGTLRLNGSTNLTTWTPIGAATVDNATFDAAGDSTPAIDFVSVAPYTFFKAEIIP
jgi:hypothetical protein